ncbi:MAG TPA: hypothetical protein VLI93_13870 [Acetobacteraceae bacterium]|nr:hypothetical protein [Acetobacteraceae bacterium]
MGFLGYPCERDPFRPLGLLSSLALRHILLEQDAVAVGVYSREAGRWVRSTLIGNGVLSLPEIGAEMPLGEAYAGLEPGEAST